MENKSNVRAKSSAKGQAANAPRQSVHPLAKILPHAVIVMALMMLVFFCIDQVNEHMGFMTNEFHRWLSMLLSVAALGYSADAIARTRRAEREAEAKRIKVSKEKRAERSTDIQPRPARKAQ